MMMMTMMIVMIIMMKNYLFKAFYIFEDTEHTNTNKNHNTYIKIYTHTRKDDIFTEKVC